MEDTMQELAAALNGHEVTNDEGHVGESETPIQEPAPEAETTVDEPATAEKPEAEEDHSPKDEEPHAEKDTDPELAEDETGKRYIPKDRFDKVYGKMKAYERELKTPKAQPEVPYIPSVQQPVNPVSAIETELLFEKLPQFNPNSGDYSPELDAMGAEIYKSAMIVDTNPKSPTKGQLVPTMTKLEAARKAVQRAEKLTGQILSTKAEARTVKAIQSDHGITNRVTSRTATSVNPDAMSDREMEAYLKETGQW